MQTPVEIDFRNMDVDARLRAAIAEHVSGLEDVFGRITACRVVIKGPGGHHRTGQFDVNVRLALPNGREVNVGRTAAADERFTDVDFAINHAFRRARRRLQDQVRQMQGKVKAHAPEPTGIVAKLDPSGEFGFIESEDNRREIYFHRNSVLNGAFARLAIGSRVTFAEEMGEKGAQASTVKLLGKHGMR
jgi:cold shock CspA family protein